MAKEYKKIGSNLDLKGIVIHQVKKEAGTRTAFPKEAKGILKIDEKEKLFVGKLNDAYFKRSSPVYGIFANANTRFKNSLQNYLSKNDFFSFSIEALNNYKIVLENTPPSTGGFLIFSHYYNSDRKYDYMLVLTINNKDGYVVSETDLTINDIKNLDLSKVDVACMINLTKWQEMESGADKDSKTYLSFVKGNKDVSYYFMNFIDCENKTSSSESTTRMIKAIDEYCNVKDYDRETKIRKRNAVSDYCIKCMNEKNGIQLAAISSILNPEEPDDFQVFAADEQFGVSPLISGDRSKLKYLKYVIYSGDNLKVEFDLDLLKKGKIVYNAKNNQLTIKDLPQGLIAQIPQ